MCQADGTWDGTAPTCKKRTEYICFLLLRFDLFCFAFLFENQPSPPLTPNALVVNKSPSDYIS